MFTFLSVFQLASLDKATHGLAYTFTQLPCFFICRHHDDGHAAFMLEVNVETCCNEDHLGLLEWHFHVLDQHQRASSEVVMCQGQALRKTGHIRSWFDKWNSTIAGLPYLRRIWKYNYRGTFPYNPSLEIRKLLYKGLWAKHLDRNSPMK